MPKAQVDSKKSKDLSGKPVGVACRVLLGREVGISHALGRASVFGGVIFTSKSLPEISCVGEEGERTGAPKQYQPRFASFVQPQPGGARPGWFARTPPRLCPAATCL